MSNNYSSPAALGGAASFTPPPPTPLPALLGSSTHEPPQLVVYGAFAGCHMCWGLLMPALLYFTIGIPGMVFNTFCIYVTIRSK